MNLLNLLTKKNVSRESVSDSVVRIAFSALKEKENEKGAPKENSFS